MAKILTDREMLEIVTDAVCDHGFIDDSGQYYEFLQDLAALICKHFGGTPGGIGEPDGTMGWTVGFHINDAVPSYGGVFAKYDTDVTWKDGNETQR